MTILPARPLARVLIGGLAVLAATGLGIATIAGRPAPTGTTEVRLAQPADDEPTSTTTTAPAEVPAEMTQDVARAETAASKAEAAATRAEGAATHVDQVATTTTTTTAPPAAPTTTTTMTVAAPVEEPTTTTTVAPKQWVEVGRFPVGNFDPDVPLHITVTLQTGVVRVTGLVFEGAVWLGDSDQPSSCAGGPMAPTLRANGAGNCPDHTDWPLGEQVLTGGQIYGNRAVSGFDSPRPVVVEEYR